MVERVLARTQVIIAIIVVVVGAVVPVTTRGRVVVRDALSEKAVFLPVYIQKKVGLGGARAIQYSFLLVLLLLGGLQLVLGDIVRVVLVGG